VEDLNGLMQQLMKTALQRMLDTELDVHLGRRGGMDQVGSDVPVTEGDPSGAAKNAATQLAKNRRNGYSPKTVQGTSGELRLDIPRDRQGSSGRKRPSFAARDVRRTGGEPRREEGTGRPVARGERRG
jgi:putative transposase